MPKKILFFLFLFTGLLTSCSSPVKQDKENEKNAVVHFTEPAELLTLDTTQEEDFVSFNAQNQVLEGLYQLNEKDEIIPAVAKALPEISSDKLTYTLSLRKDAKWSNGTAVTAQDFIYAWQRAVDPVTAPSYASLFVSTIVNADAIYHGKLPAKELGVEAPDDYTLIIHLVKPTPYFLSLLTFETFFPINQAFAEKQGDKYGTSSETTLYNGPFTLKHWKQTSDTWSYVKNPSYWDQKSVKINEVKITVIKSTSTAVNLYQTGEIDWVVLDGEFSKQHRQDDDFQNQPDTKIGYLRMNQAKDHPLNNVSLRKAVALAVDRNGFVKNILGDGSLPAEGFVPKDFAQNPETGQDFREDSGVQQKYQKAEALKAWEQAKSELKQDKITLTYLTKDTDSDKKTGEYLTEQLSTLLTGLEFEVAAMPSNNVQARYLSGDYDIVFSQWMPDFKDPITFLDMFASDSGLNHVNYSSHVYDELIKNAVDRDAADEAKRWQNLLAAEHVLLAEDYVIAPIYQQQTAVLQNKDLSGIVKHAFGSPYSFKYIQLQQN